MKNLLRSFLPVALGLASIGGCSSQTDGLPRESVTGQVLVDGKPLATGLITLSPLSGDGPIASGVVQEGAFTINREDGPTPGKHKVEIWAREATGKKVPDPEQRGQFIDEIREKIPARYNLSSQLVAQVAKGESNQFSYELSSQKVAEKTKPKTQR